MSGFTATGATVLTGLDALPLSVNVWRCFLMLIGGLGIIVLAVAILPLLGVGGTQLFKAETRRPDEGRQAHAAHRRDRARPVGGVLRLSGAACMLAYRWAGMSWVDAFMHMCTTMGLGGFSSHDASFGYWNSPLIEARGDRLHDAGGHQLRALLRRLARSARCAACAQRRDPRLSGRRCWSARSP